MRERVKAKYWKTDSIIKFLNVFVVLKMELKLTNRGRWILASLLLSISVIIFAIGWTSPFWPEWYPILGSDFFKTIFFFISSGIFVILFFFGLYLLATTTSHPIKPSYSPEVDEIPNYILFDF